MLTYLKNLFIGVDDNDAIPEAFERDPVAPAFAHLSEYLSYAAWKDEEELFYLDYPNEGKNKPQGLGFVIELNPILGADDEVMQRLMSVLQTLPQNVGVQFSILGSPLIDDFLNGYSAIQARRLASGNDKLEPTLFAELAKKRVSWWRKGSLDGLYSGNPMRFRNFRAILSVNVPESNINSKYDLERILNMREGLIAGLKASNMYLRKWGPVDLIEWTRNLLNPERMVYGKNREIADEWDELMPLRDQMISPSTSMKVVNSGRELRFGCKENGDAVSVRCLSVSQYPGSKPFHLSGMGHLIGDPVQINLNYTCPFLITMNVVRSDFETSKAKVTLKSARATTNASSPMAKVLPEFGKKARDWQIALESFEDGSGGTIELFHLVTLFDKPERITASENAARAIWQTNGFSLAEDQYLQIQSYLASLPMCLNKDMIKHLDERKRFVTKTLVNAVALSPVIGEWRGVMKGVSEAVIGLFGRNGQAMGIDLFANPSGNYNAAVIGTSGSGKSFFINELVRNYLGAGARAWVIDVGRSYQKLCQFLGGQYIEFDSESKIIINPFDMIKDFSDELTMLKLIFSLMIAPSEGLNDYQMSRLELAIINTWNKLGVTAQNDDLQVELMSMREQDGSLNMIAYRMGEQLQSFTSKGVYGRWFTGKSNLEFTSDFVVLEMEELKSKPDLQQVIMRFVMYRITQEMYLNRGQPKIVVIDEAWDLLAGNESAGKFIEDGYRRARKYGGAFITGTQGADDYLRTPAALATLSNSDWIFILRGKEITIETLKSQINLTPYMVSRIRSLNTEAGQYSDIFVYCGSAGYGIGRLVSDPYNALLSSTKSEDFEAIRQKQAHGLSIGDAVGAVLADRGYILEEEIAA